MKIKLWIIFALIAVDLFSQQYPIIVQVTPPQPFPNTREEAIKLEGFQFIHIINTSLSTDYNITLSGILESDNGINASFDPITNPPKSPIKMPAGQMISLSAGDLSNLYSNIKEGNIFYSGIDRDEVIKTNQLPEGNYTICLQALDWDSGKPLSADQPFGCSNNFGVKSPEPPFLIRPKMDESFAEDYAFIEVRWLPVVGTYKLIEYQVEVIKTNGNDPYDLFKENRNIVISQDGIMSNVLLIDESYLKLNPGKYAVRVTAYDPFKEIAIANGGHSDIHEFTIVENRSAPQFYISAPDLDAEIDFKDVEVRWMDDQAGPRQFYYLYGWERNGQEVEEVVRKTHDFSFGPIYDKTQLISTSELEAGKEYVVQVRRHDNFRDYFPERTVPINFKIKNSTNPERNYTSDCGGDCEIALPSSNRAVTTWQNGSEISIGYFTMRLDNVNIQGSTYSGRATILTNEFLTRDVDVNLNNIKINEDGEVFMGLAQANSTVNMTQLSNPTSRTFDQFESLRLSSGTGLPMTKGDLIITALHFYPNKATANVASAIRMNGNRLSRQDALWFLKEDVCITSGGFGFSGDHLTIALDTDVEFSDNNNLAYVFKAKAQNSSSRQGFNSPVNKIDLGTSVNLNVRNHTFGSFDCDGICTVFAKGTIKLNQSTGMSFGNLSEIEGYFNSNFTNWSDAMGFVHFDARNKKELLSQTRICDEDEVSGHIIVNRLPQFSFNFCSGILDHSFSHSLEGERDAWTGIYFDKLTAKLPKAIKDINDNRVEVAVSGKYDGLGFHVQGDTEVTSGLGKMGQWAALVSEVDLEIISNRPITSELSGALILPFSASLTSVNYDMNFNWSNGRSRASMIVSNLGDSQFRFIPWDANFELFNSSRINVDLRQNDIALTTDFDGLMTFNRDIGGIPDNQLEGLSFNGLEMGNGVTGSVKGIHVNDFSISEGEYKIAGYSSDITGINVVNDERGNSAESRLTVDYEFKLDDLRLGFLGDTRFTIKSTQSVSQIGVQSYELNSAMLSAFDISIDIPVLEASGRISHIIDESGSEFSGELKANNMSGFVLKAMSVDGRFGARENYKYWALNANGELSNNIPLFSGLSINSFGGGVYYNMIRARQIDGTQVFSPANNQEFGISANMGIVHEKPGFFAGSFGLNTIFSSSGVEEVELNGIGDFWYDGSVSNRQNTKIQLSGALNFNFRESPFMQGDFGYTLNFNDDNYSITGSRSAGDGSVGFRFGWDRNWYVRIGTQASPVFADIELLNTMGNEALLNGRAEVYFATGSQRASNTFNLLFGLRTNVNGNNEFNQELLFADRFRYSYDAYFNVDLELGYNSSICPGLGRNGFFGYGGIGLGLEGNLRYFDRCDDWNPLDWDWDGDGDDGCDVWRNIIDLDLDVAAQGHFSPWGGHAALSFRFTVVDEFSIETDMDLGTPCQ